MKKLSSLLFFAVLFLLSPSGVGAQIRVNINVQPQWGPEDYDYVEYYYLPEVGIYYYAPTAQFIYRQGSRWIYTYRLPYKYRHLNLYSTYKVVINKPRPYLRHNYYSSHYKEYRNNHSKQGNIRDSRDPRYKNGNRDREHYRNRERNDTPDRSVQPRSANDDRDRQQSMDKNTRGNNDNDNRGRGDNDNRDNRNGRR